ncbi:MAG: hypothetical protein ACK5CL_09390 [Sphingomonadales bacterium]
MKILQRIQQGIQQKLQPPWLTFSEECPSKTITTESYFLRLFAYIHQNPVKHGFTPHIDEWPASSYRLFFSSNPLKWLNTVEMEERLGYAEKFRTLHHPIPIRKAV